MEWVCCVWEVCWEEGGRSGGGRSRWGRYSSWTGKMHYVGVLAGLMHLQKDWTSLRDRRLVVPSLSDAR